MLGVELRVFAAGREAEEIRALWRAAHQKVLLDEQWLQGLLGTRHPRLARVPRVRHRANKGSPNGARR